MQRRAAKSKERRLSSVSIEDEYVLAGGCPFESDIAFVRERMRLLVEEGVVLAMDEKIRVITHMHTSELRNTMADFFARYAQAPVCLSSLPALKTLAEITKYLLAACVHDRENDHTIVH